MKELIGKLHQIGVIKFGTFEIKRNFVAPFQVDFSKVISHPAIAKEVCAHLWKKAQNLSFDCMCGVPVTGACFANFIAWEHEQPLIVKREDPKRTAKVEGVYKTGQRALLIQDLLLSAQPALDTVDDLEEEGIEVRDVLSFIDMEMGAKKKIKLRGFVPHSLIGMGDVLQVLFDAGKIPGDQFKLMGDFLENV